VYARLGVALALGLIAACQHSAPHRPGEEFVETIRFEGNRAIGAKELRDGLALHRAQEHGAAPDPYLVAVDGERVRGIYVRHGYLEVKVHSRVDHQGEAATVVYRIDEGPRAKTRIVISGLPNDAALPESRVRRALPLRDGAPFEYEPYDTAKVKLLGVVEDAGYAHARLDAHVIADRVKHEAIVELVYDTGPKCHFGAIEVDGADAELRAAVRARLSIATGQTYSTSAIAKSQRAIYDMKRFSTVRVLPDKTDGDTVDVRVTVSEGSRNEVMLGGGFGIDPVTYEVRGRAGYSILGWPTPLTNLDIDTRPAYAWVRDTGQYEPRARATATLTRLDLFHPFITGEAEVGYDYMVWEAYTSYGPHLRLGLQTPLGTRALKLRVGWMIEDFAFTNLSTLFDPTLASSLGLDRSERVAELQQALRLDLRDSPIEPHLGVYAALQVAEGSTYVGGAENFTQATPELRGYLPLGSSVVLAGRARAGAFWGDVPATERYFAGGAASNRGFSERQLSPTLTGMVGSTFESLPVGGGGLFDSSVEVRARLGTYRKMGVGGVVFLDGADVENRFSEIRFGDLYWAAGTGLRLFTAVGAIGVDVGYRLNRFGSDDAEPGSRYAFHLSLGEAY
jgi:outer membrane protein assembly factor BamA